MLLLTKDPAVAASWLERLPIKLPPGPSLTGAECNGPVAAQPYPAGVPYFKAAAHAPFTYGRDAEERERVRPRILGGGV